MSCTCEQNARAISAASPTATASGPYICPPPCPPCPPPPPPPFPPCPPFPPRPDCPWPDWIHPIPCPPPWFPPHRCDGPTLIIHQILLEAGGEQGCVPQNFTLRITGPSFPDGQIFTIRAGSCLELDEPLVLAGLIPGRYEIEQIFKKRNEFISTLTGPVCYNTVCVHDPCFPVVVTIVSRRVSPRCCHRHCHCHCHCIC